MAAKNRKRGQSLVEFALIAPLLLGLAFSIFDGGRSIFYYEQISAGAREGGRQAVLLHNQGTNLYGYTCAPGPCSVPGVLPAIRNAASFGFPTVYADSTSLTTPPSYGTYVANSDPTQPGIITLASSATPNTAYVFVYELDPNTGNVRWACTSCGEARLPGYFLVVVDIRMKFIPMTLISLGATSGITLDAQTVQRQEY
jgi:hypothetical protein